MAVDLRRHPRARNYTLRIAGPAEPAVLTMPKRGSIGEARRFLDRNAGWLRRQIERLPEPMPITDAAVLPLRGVAHTIRHAPERRGTVAVESNGHAPELVVAGAAPHLKRRVIDFLKREARRDLEPAVLNHAAALGVHVKAIRLGDPSSRWGSCSADGRLSFSWRLIMAPPQVLDYLAAHEVAHLSELNHGPRFWRVVATVCPDYRTARGWLSRHGTALTAIGAGD